MAESSPTLSEAANKFLDVITASRSINTTRAYQQGLTRFMEHLSELGMSLTHPIASLDLSRFASFIDELRGYSPATEQLYIMSVKRFYQFLASEELVDVNAAKLTSIVQTRARRPGQRLPQFPRKEIETILKDVLAKDHSGLEGSERLQSLRDTAFIVTLADTGLRVHETCGLRRGDFDWDEQKAIVVGKGNTQAIVRFSRRASLLITAYLRERSSLDGNTGRPLGTLPIFSRHDRGAGKKVKPITTATGRNIVNHVVAEALGTEALGRITPHSFRHYFVTTVLRGSGGNLKLAQELARHKNIQVTQRYAHLSQEELDRGYHSIFEGDE